MSRYLLSSSANCSLRLSRFALPVTVNGWVGLEHLTRRQFDVGLTRQGDGRGSQPTASFSSNGSGGSAVEAEALNSSAACVMIR